MSFPALLASGILLFTACGGEGAKGASIDASTDPEDASIPDPSEFVFEPEQIRTYRLTVDPDDWAAIYADPREKLTACWPKTGRDCSINNYRLRIDRSLLLFTVKRK